MAATPKDALTLGWIEALERRCTFRRPRERLILATQPPGPATSGTVTVGAPTWWTMAHELDGMPTWLPFQEAVLASQWRGASAITTDSTGMSAHTSKERAVFHGLREWVERSALHQWWTQRGSRCSIHTDITSDLLKRSPLALPHSDCEVWHLRRGNWHVAGCLIFTEHGERLTAAFGGGAGVTVDSAVHSAWREAFQMHTAPRPVASQEGRVRFDPPNGHNPVGENFRARFLETFPSRSDCGEIETAPIEERGTESLVEAVDGRAVTVDCGDELTDALGLHVLRVVCPELPRFTPDTRAPSGLTPVFLGG
ncbi:YcaO-like family protein [Streptomyces phaeofaciens]